VLIIKVRTAGAVGAVAAHLDGVVVRSPETGIRHVPETVAPRLGEIAVAWLFLDRGAGENRTARSGERPIAHASAPLLTVGLYVLFSSLWKKCAPFHRTVSPMAA
jgi:hypothetical protein